MKMIHFKNEESLSKFLAAFILLSTATFEVIPDGSGGYALKFLGGF